MNKNLANALKFLLFIGVGFGILFLMYRSQQTAYLEQCKLDGTPADQCSLLDKLIADFKSANPLWLLMTLVAFSVSNLSRSLRWNMMLRTFGNTPRLINAFLTINLGYFANLGFPRIGEVVRAATMARYEKISLERVVGTIVVGRTIDVVMLLSITGIALLLGRERLWNKATELVDLGDKVETLQTLVIFGAIAGVLVLGLVWWQRARIMDSAIGQKIIGVVKGFGEGMQTALKVKSPLLFFLHSINIWIMYVLMTYFVILAFSPTAALNFEAALVTFVSGGWGIVIPSPGGMGTYHFLTGEALQLYGISSLNSFSWANISFFTINVGCNVLIGLIALLALPRINREA
ncbi:flippase-like domain-containing protein [Neolewinella aurantiaca]|uniref:Flippase-like domain-containing protein n=1 Tax=Neolewinella aurantiaca TaxID=2602767 RepID=A0A5C7FWV1_9BACT|nr:lysylphosphatidylglycerol synthase transmembrane domain-containing protein [Neolewinella aurantiaca]TXF89371.1 flippase-like domain-containing protein [Neolewinella aurantiaca]